VAALAVVAGVAVQPGVFPLHSAPATDSSPWYDDTPAEQLRQDQCLMAHVLRLGGPTMAATAQDGLNQPADKLHVLANREHWEQTPSRSKTGSTTSPARTSSAPDGRASSATCPERSCSPSSPKT
jgi:hypothetical protein